MEHQSTNGPADDVVVNEALVQRAAALSADMVRREASPGLAVTSEMKVAELTERMDVIREAMQIAMKEGVDYGKVSESAKPGLWKPGAEKLVVMFKLDVQSRNELVWGPGNHLTVISRATVYHAPTGIRLGYGEGICTSRERNYAYRTQERTCPICHTAAVIKGKEEYGGGWLCYRKKKGCGAKFADGDKQIETQEIGEVENPDLPDTWNAVDKMAKKRGYVDAALSVTGASAIFTQDIGADPSEATGESDRPHGPVVTAEIKQQALRAAARLRGGDVDEARALWEKIQAALDAYMPHAAAIALVHAAGPPDGTSSPPASEPATASKTTPSDKTPEGEPGTQTTAANSGREAVHGEAEQPAATAQADTPHTQLGSAAQEGFNPHGSLVRSLADVRGVHAGDLANLIRVAAGGSRIADEKAAGQLEEMLAKITEPIARQTLELIDMLHPADAHDESGEGGTVIGVDFERFEPPRAA